MFRILITCFLLTSCRANLQPTVPVLNETKEDYTYDPEAEICSQSQGVTILLTLKGQEVTFCQFDRALIANDTLFRLHTQNTQSQAVTLFSNRNTKSDKHKRRSRKNTTIAMGNPAIMHCLQNNGTPLRYEGELGKIAICELEDGSMISAWTLFNGPQQAIGLTRILKEKSNYRIGKNTD